MKYSFREFCKLDKEEQVSLGSLQEDLSGTVKKKKMKQLEDLLKKHDWFYFYSDDPRYYKKGTEEQSVIRKMIDEIGKDGMKLYKSYGKKKGVMESFKELQEVIASDIRKKIISDGIVYEILVDTIMLSKWVGIRKKTASHIKAIEIEKNIYMMEYQKREKDYNNAGMNNTDLKTWKKLISTKQIKKASSSFN